MACGRKCGNVLLDVVAVVDAAIVVVEACLRLIDIVLSNDDADERLREEASSSRPEIGRQIVFLALDPLQSKVSLSSVFARGRKIALKRQGVFEYRRAGGMLMLLVFNTIIT